MLFSAEFWICQSLCKIPQTTTKKNKYNILWYENVGNSTYVRSTADYIYAQSVIDQVFLTRHSRFSFKLSKSETDRILKLLESVCENAKDSKKKKNSLKTISSASNKQCCTTDFIPHCSFNKADDNDILKNNETMYPVQADFVTDKTNTNLDSSVLEPITEPALLETVVYKADTTSVFESNIENASLMSVIEPQSLESIKDKSIDSQSLERRSSESTLKAESKNANNRFSNSSLVEFNVDTKETSPKKVIFNLLQKTENYSNVYTADTNESSTYVSVNLIIESEKNVSNVIKGETLCKNISNLEYSIESVVNNSNEEFNTLCIIENDQSNISVTVQSKFENKNHTDNNKSKKILLDKKLNVAGDDFTNSSFINRGANLISHVKSQKRHIQETTDSDNSDYSVKISPAKKKP